VAHLAGVPRQRQGSPFSRATHTFEGPGGNEHGGESEGGTEDGAEGGRGEGQQKGRLIRRRSNAAYRRANRERVEEVQSAIDAALAEGAKLREAISRKLERRIETAEARERRAPRRK